MKNPEAVKKWVAALRSGEFEQTQEVLHNKETGGFCCLGVACVLAKREGVIPRATRWSYIDCCGNVETAIKLDENFAKVREWLGLRDAEGSYGHEKQALTRLNDRGSSFKDIADVIESEPEGLFE